MALKRYFCLLALTGIVSANAVFTQSDQFAPIQRSNDPFAITPGSSFTASGSGASRSNGGTAIRRELIASDFQEALAIVTRNYVDSAKADDAERTTSAIRSMLKTLDPHSNFYNATEYQELLGEHESEYTGTGSSIAGFERDRSIDTYIVSTFPGSPAARAGLRFGDKIVAVGDHSVKNDSPDTVRDLVRGRQGTTVRLTIERADSKAIETISIKRERVHEPAVQKGFLLKGRTGYIALTNGFSNSTSGELQVALDDLHRQGMTSLILDIRGNGGGILEQSIKVAEKFLQPGTVIVSQRGRYSDDNRTWKAAKANFESIPLVVLVDEYTASASEVLAGALQDNDRAIILGQKTFGKGLVQSVLSLPDGAGITLTAARYFTPTGRSIQRDYSDTGIYDYFNHRTAQIDKSSYAAKTVTDRVVYGGDGIAPDVVTKDRNLTAKEVRLLDPIFFFCREFLNGRVSVAGYEGHDETVRHRMIFGSAVVDDQMVSEFTAFAKRSAGRPGIEAEISREEPFVRNMLRYYLTMGTFGPESADRAKVEADPEVQVAVDTIPVAARLALAAEKARVQHRKEKSSPSLVLSEQR